MQRLSLRGLDRFRNIGLLFARGIPGVIFFYHGYQKLDQGVSGFAGFLDMQGVPAPEFFAWVTTILELGGGILLILGALTRIFALLFIVEMILAILIVKIDIGLIAPTGQGVGSELELALIAALAAVATFGPGSLSVDRNVGIERRL